MLSRRTAVSIVLSLVITLLVIAVVLSHIETKVKSNLDYAVVKTPKGPCVALVTQYKTRIRVSYGNSTVIPFEDRPDTFGMDLKKAGFLTGRSVFSPDEPGVKGRVIRIHGTLLGSNVAVIHNAAGVDVEHDLEGLCLTVSTCCP